MHYLFEADLVSCIIVYARGSVGLDGLGIDKYKYNDIIGVYYREFRH